MIAIRSDSRLLSLDAFRGITIVGMILVNNPGSWRYVYPPLRHAEWHGWTPTDFIFPFFLFIVGVAMSFSFGKRLELRDNKTRLFLHVARRTLILIALVCCSICTGTSTLQPCVSRVCSRGLASAISSLR